MPNKLVEDECALFGLIMAIFRKFNRDNGNTHKSYMIKKYDVRAVTSPGRFTGGREGKDR